MCYDAKQISLLKIVKDKYLEAVATLPLAHMSMWIPKEKGWNILTNKIK